MRVRRLVVVLAVLVCCARVFAQEGIETECQKGNKVWQTAHQLNGEQKQEAAMEAFESLARDYPKHELADDALVTAGRIASQLGKRAHAIELFELCAKNYPNSGQYPWALWELAHQVQATNPPDYKRAAQLFEQLADTDGWYYVEQSSVNAMNAWNAAKDYDAVIRVADKYVKNIGAVGTRAGWALQMKIGALMSQGKTDDALAEADKAAAMPALAVAIGPIYAQLGQSFAAQKDYQKASDYYLKAAAVAGWDSALGYYWGAGDWLLWYGYRQPEAARKIYEEYIQKHPKTPQLHEVWFRIAQIDRDFLGKRDSEIDLYKRYLDKYPDSILKNRALYSLAQAYRATNRRDEAAAMVQRLIDNPADPERIANLTWELAWIRWELQDWKKAGALFETLGADTPGYGNCEGALRQAISAAQQEKDWEKVVRLSDRYLKTMELDGMPSGSVVAMKVQALAQMGRTDDATAFIAEVSKLPTVQAFLGNIYNQFAQVYQTDKQFQKASEYYLKAAEVAVSDQAVGNLWAAAEVLSQNEPRDADGAIKIYRRMIADYPNNSQVQECYFRISWLYRDVVQDRAKAADTCLDFIADHPKSIRVPQAYWELAAAYRADERPEEALGAYADLLKKFPKCDLAPLALWEAGQIYQGQERNDKARQMYETLVKEWPVTNQADAAAQRLEQMQ